MSNAKFKTREQWLAAGVEKLDKQVVKGQYEVPKVRVSCGWPKGGRKGQHTIGQCWYSAEDGVPQIFVAPDQNDPVRILDILLHELGHACLPDAGHKKPFKQFMAAVGLEGKATATVASEDLRGKLEKMAETLGEYPHSTLNGKTGGEKKQGTRLVKVECPCCGYIVRTTAKWIETGLPSCPQGTEMEVV